MMAMPSPYGLRWPVGRVAGPDPAEERLTKEMGLRETEFLEALPAVLSGYEWECHGNVVTACQGDRTLRLEFGPEQVRRIASMSVPWLPVTLTFFDYSEADRQAFINHFNRRFQRGGG